MIIRFLDFPLGTGTSHRSNTRNPDVSAFGESRFYVYIQNLSIDLMQRFTVAIVLLVGGVGILSRFLYDGPQFRAMFYWRLMICVLTSLLVLAFSFSKRARRCFTPLYVLEYSVAMFFSGYLLIQVQDHRNLGVAVLIALPLWTVPMPAKLPARIYTVGCSFLAILGIYLRTGNEPVFLVTITLFLGLMGTVSIFLGHVIFYRLNRENFFSDRELQRTQQDIEYLARHDTMTGLLNRRGFEECLESEVDRVHRYKHPLSLIMLDLDHFKQINDTYGHSTGDTVLEEVGKLLQQETRKTDTPGRIGGEEFAVLLPETAMEQALEMAKRIREKLADKTFTAEGKRFQVTGSFGVTRWTSDLNTSEDLLGTADDVLYRAKEGGRNQVVSSEE